MFASRVRNKNQTNQNNNNQINECKNEKEKEEKMVKERSHEKAIPKATKNNAQYVLWFDVWCFFTYFHLISLSYLLKCFLNAALTKYSAMGLAQLFPNDKQNPMIRRTCQKALYSAWELSLCRIQIV